MAGIAAAGVAHGPLLAGLQAAVLLMRSVRVVLGSLALGITRALTGWGIWLLVKGNDPERAARAGGIEVLAIGVPAGLAVAWWLLRSRSR